MHKIRLSLVVLALAAGLAACGSADSISKGDVAKKVQPEFDKLAQANGQESYPEITCKDDLEAKAGASTRCSATGPDGTLGITVTVESIKDGKAQLNYKADDQVTK